MNDRQLVRRFTELAEQRNIPQLAGFIAGMPLAIAFAGAGDAEQGSRYMREVLDEVVRLWLEVKAEAQLT